MATRQLSPPPLSLTRRWDKAKWHLDAADFPAELGPAEAARHIIAALRFLDERHQLTASGTRELRDGGSDETALLAEHVRAAARGFLDKAYDSYLSASSGYGKTPPVVVLKKAWEAYAQRFDVSKRPVGTAYQALLVKHANDEPTLDGLLDAVRGTPSLLSALRTVMDDAPASDRVRIAALLDLDDSLAKGDLGFTRAPAEPTLLLGLLAYLSRPRILEAAARLVAASSSPNGVAFDRAVANAVNNRSRADWLSLSGADQKRLREPIHRLLDEEPHLALCALRVAANASSLKLIERRGTFAEEGTIETWKETAKGMVRARVERGWDELRRAITKVVTTATPRANTPVARRK